MSESQPKRSDLPVRAASALVMVAVAGTALWLGGWVWAAFTSIIGLGVGLEWTKLTFALTDRPFSRVIWLICGTAYIGLACLMVGGLGGDTSTGDHWARYFLISILVVVIGTDIGAYFAGRIVGGPKIAPAISPSKTWAGLIGGMLGAALALLAWNAMTAHGALLGNSSFPVAGLFSDWREAIGWSFGHGAIGAILAQSGDFFESWMKRRAGVKDSGALIPGHGGLFDRVDGLLAVAFVIGVVELWGILTFMPDGI